MDLVLVRPPERREQRGRDVRRRLRLRQANNQWRNHQTITRSLPAAAVRETRFPDLEQVHDRLRRISGGRGGAESGRTWKEEDHQEDWRPGESRIYAGTID